MSTMKTRQNEGDVQAFLNKISPEDKRNDCLEILRIMEEKTGEPGKMWGTSIVGFGTYHYKYDSGREGDWFLVGFSPRKQNISLHISAGFQDYENLLEKIGKHKTGVSCLYIKRLEDIDRKVLGQLISESVKSMREKYGA